MIIKFDGDNFFLSNFYLCHILWDEFHYPSVENAYQAWKTPDVHLRKPFLKYSSGQAKREGKLLSLRPDWDRGRVALMKTLLRIKFADPVLREKLLATGDQELIEGNNWHDTFWGVCVCVGCADKDGLNMLGKLLMEVREEIK